MLSNNADSIAKAMAEKSKPKLDDDTRQSIIDAIVGTKRHLINDNTSTQDTNDPLFECIKCRNQLPESEVSFARSSNGLIAVCSECSSGKSVRPVSKKKIDEIPKKEIDIRQERINEVIEESDIDMRGILDALVM
jgi:hypothetical protein